MDMKATKFWELLKNCETIEDVFYVQSCLVDGLNDEQILQLRAERAGLSIDEARAYEAALKTIKAIESKRLCEQLRNANKVILNVI